VGGLGILEEETFSRETILRPLEGCLPTSKRLRFPKSLEYGITIRYPFTELAPLTIVKTNSDFIHISLRIPAQLRTRLNEEAKRRNITLNSLVIAVLAKYDSFDKILEGTKAIPLSGAFVHEILEITSTEEMENVARKLGAKVVRKSFAFRGIAFNLDNLVKFYFEPLSAHSGWYSFNTYIDGRERLLVFEHTHGPKWTAYLKQYYIAILRSATGTEPEVVIEDETLTFTLQMKGPELGY
jgi:hypothetical protein